MGGGAGLCLDLIFLPTNGGGGGGSSLALERSTTVGGHPPPPDRGDHRGRKRSLQKGRFDWAIFGTQTFGSQTPPLSSNVSLAPAPPCPGGGSSALDPPTRLTFQYPGPPPQINGHGRGLGLAPLEGIAAKHVRDLRCLSSGSGPLELQRAAAPESGPPLQKCLQWGKMKLYNWEHFLRHFWDPNSEPSEGGGSFEPR